MTNDDTISVAILNEIRGLRYDLTSRIDVIDDRTTKNSDAIIVGKTIAWVFGILISGIFSALMVVASFV
jgi:hypothetical protein